MTAWPPPKENSDSGAKTRKIVSQPLSMRRALSCCEQLEADAQGCKRENDRNHRPTENADRDEDRGRNDGGDDPPDVARELHAELQHHADADRDETGHDVAHDSGRTEARIDAAENENDDEGDADQTEHANDAA